MDASEVFFQPVEPERALQVGLHDCRGAGIAGERAQRRPHRFVATPLSRRTVLGSTSSSLQT
jgi:hypothetical protein